MSGRHFVTLHLLPSGGAYQWCAIQQAYPPYMWSLPGPYWSADTAIAAIACLDVSSGKLVPHTEIQIPTEWLDGTGGGGENPCRHVFFDGDLYPFQVAIDSVSLGEGTDFPWSELRAVNVDENGHLMDGILIYGVGTSEVIGSFPYLQYGGEWSHKDYRDDTSLYSWRGCKSLVVSFEKSSTGLNYVMASYETSILVDVPVIDVGLPIVPGLVDVVIHEGGLVDNDAWEGDYQISAVVFPISPVVLTELNASPEELTAASPLARALLYRCKTIGHEMEELSANRTGAFIATKKALEAFTVSSINGLAFAAEILKLSETLKPLARLFKNPLNLANWAALGLSIRYGPRLTWADARTLFDSVRQTTKVCGSLRDYLKFRNSTQTHYGTCYRKVDAPVDVVSSIFMDWPTVRYNTKLRGRLTVPEHLSDAPPLIVALTDLGFGLSAQNVWDLIPWSFVVDWFVHIDDLAAMLDYSNVCDTFDGVSKVSSRHLEACNISAGAFRDLGLYGAITGEFYRRDVNSTPDSPPWGLDFSAEDLTDLNLLTLAGLIIVKFRGGK